MRLNKRSLALGVLLAGAPLFGGVSAHADPPPPFYDNHHPACGDDPVDGDAENPYDDSVNKNPVLYNPVNGHPIGVSINPRRGPDLSYWLWNVWVCVDTGNTAGNHSIGTSGYMSPNGAPGLVEHTPVCLGVSPLPPECTMVWMGADAAGQQAGQTGAQPCVTASKEYEREIRCVSAGVTPGGTAPGVAPSVTEPPGYCLVKADGICATKDVTVGVGGSVATAYVGTTPVPVGVPSACVGTRNNLSQPVVAGAPC